MKSIRNIILFSITLFLITSCRSIGDVASNANPISHEIWNGLLKKHVNPKGTVDYKGFLTDSTEFKNYLNLLSSHHPNPENWSEKERLAYWINAYNAFTIELILQHYPTKSIKDIKKGITFVNSVWDIKFIKIENQTYDLNNLEHGILRPKFNEPRIHFAINCASVSCPNLRNEAYTAALLEQQLEEQARLFINDSSKNKISTHKIQLSKIFSWFSGDFTKGQSLITFLNRYSNTPIQANAQKSFLDYDWSLNE